MSDEKRETAVNMLVSGATEIYKRADAYSRHTEQLVDRVVLISWCANLPGDMPARIVLQPGSFGFKA